MPCSGLYTENEVEQLKQRIRELELALKPFAALWDRGKLTGINRTLDLKKASEVYHRKEDDDSRRS